MQPDAITQIGEVLSPSQANLFLACSAKYWFRYGLGLPDPPGANMIRGKVVHRMAEHYFRAVLAGSRPDPDEMGEVFQMIWDEECADALFDPDDDIDQLKMQAAALSRKYLDEVASEIEPAAVEVPVNGTIAGTPVRGVIDVLDTQGRVIDIKTSQRTPSGLDPSHGLQLSTYSELEPRASGKARLDYVIANKSPKVVSIDYYVSDADRRFVRSIYPAVQAAIQEGRFIPNRNSTLCSRRHCNFWRSCEETWGGTVKGAEE